MSPDEHFYRTTWETLLVNVGNWSVAAVRQWVDDSGFGTQLEAKDSLLFHRYPQHWIAGELVPSTLRPTLPPRERRRLEAQIARLLSAPDGSPTSRTDWPLLRAELADLIQSAAQPRPTTSSVNGVSTNTPRKVAHA